MYRLSIALVIGVGAVLAAACDDSNSDGTGSAQITELPRALTVSERAVIGDSNDFGLELVARVAAADPRSNVVLSPLSASMALGMTLNGANGTTFEAMRSALGFGSLTQEQINDAYRDLIDLLTGLDPEVRFEIANAIWANRDLPFHDTFFNAVAAAFDARAESRDFGDPATVDAINAWVKEHTGGHIDKIVEPPLDPALMMLLANAIYFDGAWTREFDPAETRPEAFTREDGSRVTVDMMSIAGDVRTASGPSYEAVELPYGGEAFSMVIVLPRTGVGARHWLAELDADAWAALTEGLTPSRLDLLSIPRLKLTYGAYLNDALRATGMDPAFRPGADFTRMSPRGDELCIDSVYQKTFVEVDERGTRAAAVTVVRIVITSGGSSFHSFVANRPFVFAIRERLSGTVLFVGLVGDPTAEAPGPEPTVSGCTGLPLP